MDLSCRIVGAGDAVVLLHGLAGSWRWWRGNVAALAASRRVALVDLPRRVVLAEAPEAVHRVLAANELQPADVVGHSLGGLVALRLAARWPEAVRRLVLVSPAALLPRRALHAYAGPLLVTLRHATPSFLVTLAADAARAGPRALLRSALDVLADDVREDLPKVRARTLIVVGERDSIVPPSVGELLCRELPDARLVVLAGAAHVPMVERPRDFERVLLEFLDAY